MTGMHVRGSRCRGTGLLARPPLTAYEHGTGWADLVVDPTRQLEVLVELLQRELISREEYERFVARLAFGIRPT